MKNYFANKMNAVRDGMKDNKGFSLVELIIVVAIMAVLMGVLAPQYLKFVESSRLQSDMSAANEIVKVMRTAVATQSSTPTGAVVVWDTQTATNTSSLSFGTGAELQSEVESVLGTGGSSVGAAASTAAGKMGTTAGTITFTVEENNGVPYITTDSDYVSFSLQIPLSGGGVDGIATEDAANAEIATSAST